MTLTKLGAARQQLGTALALFIDDCDPVSVQVLACGGGEVAEHLSAEAGQQLLVRVVLGAQYPLHRGKLLEPRVGVR